MTDLSTTPPIRVLFVCLGNICRSPAAEAITRTLASGGDLSLELDSAGTGDWHLGAPPDRRMQAAARDAGYDLSALRARRIQADDFERFDLIIAMDRRNRADIEALRPPGNETPVRLFLGYGPSERTEVPDPYLEGGFDGVLRLLEHAAMGLLADLQRQ